MGEGGEGIKEINDEAFKNLIALPPMEALIKYILVLLVCSCAGTFVIGVLHTCLFHKGQLKLIDAWLRHFCTK